jgi:hypothetical protein
MGPIGQVPSARAGSVGSFSPTFAKWGAGSFWPNGPEYEAHPDIAARVVVIHVATCNRDNNRMVDAWCQYQRGP